MRKLYRLSDHIYIFPFDPSEGEQATDMPNLGYIKGDNQSLLFDTGTGPKQVNQLLADLTDLNLRKPDLAVISHYHWDHSFGAAYLDCPCCASQYTYDKMKEMIAMKAASVDTYISNDYMPLFCKQHLHNEYGDTVPELKLPDEIIEDSTIIDLGNLKVYIKPLMNPHCEGSLLLYIPNDGVLFLGDATSGYVVDYDFIDDLPRLKVLYNTVKEIDCQYVVTGHASIISKRDYLKKVLEKLNQ